MESNKFYIFNYIACYISNHITDGINSINQCFIGDNINNDINNIENNDIIMEYLPPLPKPTNKPTFIPKNIDNKTINTQ